MLALWPPGAGGQDQRLPGRALKPAAESALRVLACCSLRRADRGMPIRFDKSNRCKPSSSCNRMAIVQPVAASRLGRRVVDARGQARQPCRHMCGLLAYRFAGALHAWHGLTGSLPLPPGAVGCHRSRHGGPGAGGGGYGAGASTLTAATPVLRLAMRNECNRYVALGPAPRCVLCQVRHEPVTRQDSGQGGR